MLRTLLFFIKLGIAVYVFAWVAARPGEVSVQWLGYRVDTRIGVLLFAILVVVVALVLLWWLWRWLVRSPRHIARARADSRRRKAYKSLTQGLVAVAAGDAAEARRQAKLAGTLLNDPPLTLLLAAQAAQLGGDERAAENYFRAMLKRPETSFLGLRGLLMQSLKTGNDKEALKLARQAATERPNTGWAVQTLLELELKAGDWTAAEATLRRAVKLKAIEPAAAKRMRAVLLTERARVGNDVEDAIGLLRDALKLAPDLVPARALLAANLGRAGRGREAGRVIEQGWGTTPHAELAAVYGTIDPAEEPLARARRFERLAGLNPGHPESRIALAAANLAAELPGPARAELERLIAQIGDGAPVPQRLARLMARLEEAEGNAAAARQWLLAAAEGAADPAWTCEKCGTVAAAWSARCGHCHAFDSLAWRAPVRPDLPLIGLARPGAAGAAPALTGTLPAVVGPPGTPPLPAPAAAASADGGEAPIAPVDAARRVN
jgi:HemY protein